MTDEMTVAKLTSQIADAIEADERDARKGTCRKVQNHLAKVAEVVTGLGFSLDKKRSFKSGRQVVKAFRFDEWSVVAQYNGFGLTFVTVKHIPTASKQAADRNDRAMSGLTRAFCD